ncbi:hypothetical protein ACIRD2_03160 [Streptomyces sp. NPDC093595]|uniref:hypothetical protein n=1 Tax=Streptomyces sp. NPDC093595 TaxID=3366045 RepID=UPI0037FDBD01
MKRSEAIQFHTEEATTLDRTAALAPNSPGGRQCAELANDHRAMADAARLGDYPEDLED